MEPEQVEVDPVRLRGIADQVEQAESAVRGGFAANREQLVPVDDSGWSAVAASGRARQAWGTFLTNLGGALATLSVDLVTAADDYVTSDRAAAARVGEAGGYGRVF